MMYECFHCGARAVIWDADFDGEDYGYEYGGIIHECHCMHCGAQITYYIPNFEEENEGEATASFSPLNTISLDLAEKIERKEE